MNVLISFTLAMAISLCVTGSWYLAMTIIWKYAQYPGWKGDWSLAAAIAVLFGVGSLSIIGVVTLFTKIAPQIFQWMP